MVINTAKSSYKFPTILKIMIFPVMIINISVNINRNIIQIQLRLNFTEQRTNVIHDKCRGNRRVVSWHQGQRRTLRGSSGYRWLYLWLLRGCRQRQVHRSASRWRKWRRPDRLPNRQVDYRDFPKPINPVTAASPQKRNEMWKEASAQQTGICLFALL